MNINNLFVEPKFLKTSTLIDYSSSIFFIGSCFSVNISRKLSEHKFNVLSNPYGTLFDPISIKECLLDISLLKTYKKSDLFYSNELYSSWAHHSCFSDTSEEFVLNSINNVIQDSKSFLDRCSHIFITLGTAYSYFHLTEKRWVANCHKVDQKKFLKKLLSIETILESLESIYKTLKQLKPNLNIALTVSPVRHIKDGLIENNRSKARLIEAIQMFVENHPSVYYFPSFEIMIDVLRDYRYYNLDLVHPNDIGTNILFEYFKTLCIDPKCFKKMDSFYQLGLAKNHIALHPKTVQHKVFLKTQLEKAQKLALENPNLCLKDEIDYFKKRLEIWPKKL